MPKGLAEYLSEVRRAITVGDQPSGAQAGATAPITEKVDLTAYRPITPDERALIAELLDHSGPEAQAFLPQLEGMMVQSNCTCGCPSFSIAVAEHHERTGMRRNLVADMFGEASNGTVGVILWQAGGKLTGLEVYDLAGRELTGKDNPFGLPGMDTLHGWKEEPPTARV